MSVLKASFTDGQLVRIAKIYQELTGMTRSPAKLTQHQVNVVINYLNKIGN